MEYVIVLGLAGIAIAIIAKAPKTIPIQTKGRK
jgi:hypothetical protein